MTYVRSKRRGRHTYYSIVESYRNDQGQPRQRTVVSLGRYPSVAEALEGIEREITRLVDDDAKAAATIRDIEARGGPPLGRWRVLSRQSREQVWYGYATRTRECTPSKIAELRERLCGISSAANSLFVPPIVGTTEGRVA